MLLGEGRSLRNINEVEFRVCEEKIVTSKVLVRERERERQRDRERERQRDRETERDRDRQTDRHVDRERNSQTDRNGRGEGGGVKISKTE